MAEHLTEKLVKTLPAPIKGNKLFYDDEVKGFAVRVTHAGARSFVVNYYVHGRERRITIGSHPDWTVTSARSRAKEIKQQVDIGEDPLGQRIEDREAPTVNDLWKEYEAKHLPTKRPRSAQDDASMWKTYILPRMGFMKVGDITAQDVDGLHSWIGETKPVRANRVIEVLRKAINLSIRWQWRSDNPCTGVHRNHEEKRERYLSPTEIDNLVMALNTHPNQRSCDAIRMLLLTGARKSEVLSATWTMFDLETGVWVKPSSHTKQKKLHRVPLSEAVKDLLLYIKSDKPDPVFVFPGRVVDHPLTDVKKTWTAVCETAGIELARIHDLRHSFASILASKKLSLPIIGALLGHTQTQTTARYAHLLDDPLREATELASSAIQTRKG